MTNYCPTSFIDTLDRTKSLGCNKKYKYHCMRNKRDEMVEKCLEFSWMQKDECAVYDTGAQKIDAWPCNITRGVCPKQHYLSNEVMSYSACVPLLPTGNSTERSQLESNGVGMSTVIIIVIICIGVIALGVAVLLHFQRKRLGHENKDEENTGHLLGRDSINRNDEEEEKKSHLEKEEKHLKYFECKGECTKYMLETIKEHLLNNVNVFIIGKPGSGKTTLAWTVCKQMHGHFFRGQKWYMYVKASTSDIPYEEEMKLILLLDGRFESAWTTERMVEKLLDELQKIRYSLPSKQILTITTMSHEAYQRISKYRCIERLTPIEIIDLDAKENSLSMAEMSRVLETYGVSVRNLNDAKDSYVLSKKQLRLLRGYFNHHGFFRRDVRPKIGFPLIASLMPLHSHFLENAEFLQEPIKHFLRSINMLKESSERVDKNKYCTIVYTTFNRGYVDNANVNQDLFTKIGYHHDHPEAEIDPDFYILRKRTDSVYEFLNESLLRAFFAAYWCQHMGFVIAHCPIQVLLKYIVSNRENISSKERLFNLTVGGIEIEKVLIRRIRDENVDIRNHSIWEQDDFAERNSFL